MFNKFRSLLCRDWSFNLALITIGAIITLGIPSHSIFTAILAHKLFTEPGAYAGLGILSIILITSLISVLIILFSRWQFQREFGCDAPRKNQTSAFKALQPLINTKLIRLAAELAKAFRFVVEDQEKYEEQMLLQDKKIAGSFQPTDATSSGS